MYEEVSSDRKCVDVWLLYQRSRSLIISHQSKPQYNYLTNQGG